MNPEVSRRVAWAVNVLRLDVAEKDAVARAAASALTFDELPEWIQQLVQEAEQGGRT